MRNNKILYVDDDQRLCRLIKRYLEHGGYEVVCAFSGDDLEAQLKSEQFSLLLLDIMLPGKDGFTLAQEIRTVSDIPIIFLTAKANINDKVSGLEIGADDYITKPFEEKELLARVQSVLRRTKSNSTPHSIKAQAHFAGWKLNLLNQTLSSPDGNRVDITSSEYRLLSALVSKPNTTIRREEILNMISGREWTPLDRSADMAISKLRKKIEQNPQKPELIRTIRNKGYQLSSTVQFVESA